MQIKYVICEGLFFFSPLIYFPLSSLAHDIWYHAILILSLVLVLMQGHQCHFLFAFTIVPLFAI